MTFSENAPRGTIRWREIRSSLRFLDFVMLLVSIAAFAVITLLAWQGSGVGGEVIVDTPDGSYI